MRRKSHLLAIDWREGHEGSMAYNNTIYLGEGIDREWLKNGYTGGKSDAKFYNNIVVNKGNMTPGKGFNEQEIDYESNIFVGFDEVPSNDTTLIQEDPKLHRADCHRGEHRGRI